MQTHTLISLQSTFQEYLTQHSFSQEPIQLYQPIDYILSLGGKRLRPALLLMSYNLFDDQIVKALPAAFAIEVFHNFTLLHDDIMDEAPLRRGQATVHHKYDINTGILSGDVMLIYAYGYLLKLEHKQVLPKVLTIFNQMAIGVCEGQQYDMNFETSDDVQIDDYIKMITLKTAVLIAGAMKIGALIANATPEDAQHLYEFGKNMGIAFQLQDDILDTFGDPEKFGKKVGGDITQNKQTFLLLKAKSLATGNDAEKLEKLLSTPDLDESTKIVAVTQLYEKLGIRSIAEMLKQTYQDKAFNHLMAVNVSKENKKEIIKLAEELLLRDH